MLEGLYVGLVAAMLLRPSSASAVYVCSIILFDMLYSSLDGPAYFPLGATFDLASIALISRLEVSERAESLIKLSICSIALNMFGLFCYWFYITPEPYAFAFYGLYAAAIVVILKRGRGDDRVGISAFHFRLRPDHSGTGKGSVVPATDECKK